MAANAPDFARFVAIDWSGAKGRRHKGIAIAVAEAGRATPALVRPGHVWSRQEVLDWLIAYATEAPTLFGFDFSFAPPIAARGSYLPGVIDLPGEAKSFWAYIDDRCQDEDLGAASFLEQTHRPHFYFGAADGVKRDFLHHRVCEERFNAGGGGKASTVYDAIGAAQVAKASFAGMRLLHHADGRLPIWPFDIAWSEPFDPLPTYGSLIIEIYTRAFIRLAGLSGRKVRDPDQLARALQALGSEPGCPDRQLSDHETDVLIAAAGLRAIADDPHRWSPPGLTPLLARTEGWTFGVV
ncbi:hypothetical protein RCO27_02955 [Sphingosinicella sp. LHD-64]|uniref:hypothetical protein n=1 Tax=Sphingosinicella sp. LHD-64 TaxID=3072139 RepID=UPI00280F53F7|nr:hypothetical protein [Sphingosinicella sp. LHD-64]MDQ8755180.1 hypothetical protein [Sphingosinicella sp. LHD-64]